MKKLTLENINECLELLNTSSSLDFEFESNNVEDTKALGYSFAQYITPGMIITLNGELGSGKTVFLSGLASFFNAQDQVSSPTFTIVNEYNIGKDFPLYHFDVYRIENSDEFLEGIGTDYFENGTCIIEWGDEIIPDILPSNTIHIDIIKDDDNLLKRTFKIWRK